MAICQFVHSCIFLNWDITDIQYYISSRHTTQSFDICTYYEIVTTVNLVNIYYQTELQNFFCNEVFKIYSVSNFQLYNIVLLTIVTVLYITSPWLTLQLEICNFWLLSPISSPYPLPLASFNCSLYGRNYVVFVFLCLTFTSLKAQIVWLSLKAHVVENGKISLFYDWKIYMLHFLYPSTQWWTFRLFPYLRYCK